jgi:hypothetical protein
MIKVPGTPNPRFQKTPVKDDGFDPTRDDWSRHEEGARSSSNDGVGFFDEDDDDSVPSWYQDDADDDDDGKQQYHRAL